MLGLDTAAYTSRWLHRHPAEKAGLAFGLLGCAMLLPTWPGAPLVAGAATALLLGPAGLRPGALLRAARTPLLFVATGSVPLLITLGGARPVGWNPDGPGQAATVAGRSVAALLCLLLFATTTPLADVLPRLTRLGVPAAVTEVAVVTYRMIFLLLESARAVRAAQAARLGYRTWRSTYACLAGQGAAIFVRAFDRARRLEEGLALRGYDGALRVQVPRRRASGRFITGTVALLAAVVGASLVIRAVTG